jgi:hypothetical protein
MLNLTGDDADIAITIFVADREPAGSYRLRLKSRSTLHLTFNDCTIRTSAARYVICLSDRLPVPIIMQDTRLDSRNPYIAPLGTIAYRLD